MLNHSKSPWSVTAFTSLYQIQLVSLILQQDPGFRLSEMKLFVLAWPETPLVGIKWVFYSSHSTFTAWSSIVEREPLFIWFGDILAITSGTNKLEIISRWELYKTFLFKSCTIFFLTASLNASKMLMKKKRFISRDAGRCFQSYNHCCKSPRMRSSLRLC